MSYSECFHESALKGASTHPMVRIQRSRCFRTQSVAVALQERSHAVDGTAALVELGEIESVNRDAGLFQQLAGLRSKATGNDVAIIDRDEVGGMAVLGLGVGRGLNDAEALLLQAIHDLIRNLAGVDNNGIFAGDVQQTVDVHNGEIVVAMIDGFESEATVKTFYKEADHIRLQPENHTMSPIIVKDVNILGKVRGVFRYFN